MRASLVLVLAFITSTLIGCGQTTTSPAPAPGVISDDFVFGLNRVEHAYGDIDHDGKPELFLGNASTAGNAGMSFLVLKRDGQRWRPMGEIFFHPGVFRILPLALDGSIRLLVYYRMGGSEGIISTVTYRNGDFVCLNNETVHPGDGGTEEGRRRVEELFSDNSPGQPLQFDK